MVKSLFLGLLAVLLLCPVCVLAGSPLSEGMIDNDLRYEGFEVRDDGFVTGYIINSSNRTRPAVKLDMWTTTPQETRVFWRKSLNIGDMAPGARYTVKEVYKINEIDPPKIKFMFRLPNRDNFRN